MAIKTFTDNTSLPASDINTFLANSGLVYVTSTAFSGTTINVNSCFTATYDHYRVLIEVATTTSSQTAFIQMRTGTTNTGGSGYSFTGADFLPGSVSTQGGTGQAQWRVGAHTAGNAGMDVIEFYNPFAAKYTGFSTTTQGSYTPDARFCIIAGGYLANTTSYDGFSWQIGGASTGTISVYGYRKA
jgi:hypothetical protein